METNANDNLDGFMKQTKYFLQSKMVQAIITDQCTGIHHVSKWLALCPLTGQLSTASLRQSVIQTKMSICKKNF
jgi:hypothetical protein